MAPEDGFEEPVDDVGQEMRPRPPQPDELTLCALKCLDVGAQCKEEGWPEADCDYVADKCMKQYCSRYFSVAATSTAETAEVAP